MKYIVTILILICSAAAALAQSQPADTSKLSEDLIYSVNRTPERPFETARAVEVITIDDIWRKNGMTLSDVLIDEPGLIKYRASQSTGTPLIRGLVGSQVLVLVDGVKLNNSLAGTITNLDMIDLSQVERIEIVRGVVSVLGTESLGGVINIITRKGAPAGTSLGGTLGFRYSSTDSAFSAPVEVYGRGDHYRFAAGGNVLRFGDVRGGGNVGTQPFTSYESKAGHLSAQYLMSSDKTLGVSYQMLQQNDVKSAISLSTKSSSFNLQTPLRTQLGNVSYQDLTTRGFVQSLKATAYWNQQESGTRDVRTITPTVQTDLRDRDRLFGLNLELGSFFGKSHHLVYGADYTTETIDSIGTVTNLTTDVVTGRRGRYTDQAQYQSLGVYLQDHFDIGDRLTTTAGLRYGSFHTSGLETLPVVGSVDLDSKKSDVTGALNLVFHATPHLNLIANAMRGYRAPNLQDISRFSVSTTTIEIPAVAAEAEKITSYEGGVKYENSFLSGSAFYFRNKLSNLLLVTSSLFQGLPYVDSNHNGKKDAGELSVRQNTNIGTANLHGWEADVKVHPTPWLTVWANYSNDKAMTDDVQQAALVQRVPPPFGSAGLRLVSNNGWKPWGELVYTMTRSFTSGGVVLSPAFREYKVRMGASLTERLRVSAAVENLTDFKYASRFSSVYWPGRRLLLATQYRF